MNNIIKSLLYSFLFLGALFLIVFLVLFSPYISNFTNSFMSNPWTEKSLDLGSFNQNPGNYFQKQLTVVGKVSLSSEFYVVCNKLIKIVADKNNNQIKVCEGNEVLQKGKTYTLKGIIIKDHSNTTTREEYIFKVN